MSTSLESLNRLYDMDTRCRAFVKFAQYRMGAVAGVPLPDDPSLEPFHKAAVVAMTGNETALRRVVPSAYLQVVERRTIVGQLSGALKAPPGTTVAGMTGSLPRAQWRATGRPIPLARLSSASALAEALSFALMIAVTKDVALSSDDRALSLLERQLTRAIRHSEDLLFLSDAAGIPGEQSEGVLHGLSAVGSGSPGSLSEDLASLWVSVNDGEAVAPYYVLSGRGAQYLAALRENGAPLFPNLGPLGGSIFGVPVIISAAAANLLVLIDAASISLTDEGIIVEASATAAVQMDDAPTNSAVTGTGAQMVSAFQTNSVFLRIIRYLSWLRLRDDAVAYLELPIGGSPS